MALLFIVHVPEVGKSWLKPVPVPSLGCDKSLKQVGEGQCDYRVRAGDSVDIVKTVIA